MPIKANLRAIKNAATKKPVVEYRYSYVTDKIDSFKNVDEIYDNGDNLLTVKYIYRTIRIGKSTITQLISIN